MFTVQDQGMTGMSRPPGAIPPPHPAGGVASGVGPNQGSGPPPGYVGNQQQAAMMKQMMAMEQEKRVQMHMLEQQKLFREQRQQQQLLAEQVPEHQADSEPAVQGNRGRREEGGVGVPGGRPTGGVCEVAVALFHVSVSDAPRSRLPG